MNKHKKETILDFKQEVPYFCTSQAALLVHITKKSTWWVIAKKEVKVNSSTPPTNASTHCQLVLGQDGNNIQDH